ncbi:MAG: flagellar biosynthesis protein FlgG [Proteobacteria bacterium]|nr:flagellar biosynthesis protein FlgG [Pseudomonadota bacterium]
MSSAFDIAASGLRAQSRSLEISADNIANLLSLGVHPDPELAKPEAFTPQRAAFVSNAYGGVEAKAVPVTPPAYLSLQPDHPDADADGLVPLPNVSLEREMVNQIVALRMFEANVKVIQTQDRMLGALLDIVS